MSRNADRYPALQRNATLVDGIAAQERSLNGKIIYYLPTFRLGIPLPLATIQSGDIIAFTTDIPGLDIAHVGIAIQNNGEVRLIHASSSQGRVIVENRSILQQLKAQQKIFGHTHYSTPKFRKPEIIALFIFFVSFFFNIIKYFYLCPRNRSHENGKTRILVIDDEELYCARYCNSTSK